jgi:amino acid permease
LLDGSYAPGGKLFSLLTDAGKALPAWSTPKYNMLHISSGTLVLVNMLCVAFLAHYNSISYFNELENSSPTRYRKAIGAGFTIAMLVFSSMMFLGYNLFGNVAQPLILNNFHQSADSLATLARIATGCAIMFAYPLMFSGLKKSLFSLIDFNKGQIAKNGKENNKQVYRMIPVSILGLITAIAMKCGEEDVSLVLGLVGSVLGCGIAYVLPAYLKLLHIRKRKAINGGISVEEKREAFVNHILLALGVIFGAFGVAVTISDHHSH